MRKVLSLYARGMPTREIVEHLEELYWTDVSPALISAVTDAGLEDVKARQSRPLDPLYPIVYLDALHIKLKQSGTCKPARSISHWASTWKDTRKCSACG